LTRNKRGFAPELIRGFIDVDQREGDNRAVRERGEALLHSKDPVKEAGFYRVMQARSDEGLETKIKGDGD